MICSDTNIALVLTAVLSLFLIPCLHAEESNLPEADFWEEETWADGGMGLSPEEKFIFSDEEIVVSAARFAQRLSQAPSTSYVITAEDIRRSGLESIPEILRTVPGLDVLTVAASHSEVAARGFVETPTNKMLVMIDGRSVYQNSYNFVLWNALPVVLEDVKRIEVILGPGSALYGANAFSGIIHIITKDPEEAATLHLKGSLGSDHTYHHSLLHGGTWNRLGWKVSLGWDETDRFVDVTDAGWLETYGYTRRESGEASDMLKAGASLQYEPAGGMLLRVSGGIANGGTEMMIQPVGLLTPISPGPSCTPVRGSIIRFLKSRQGPHRYGWDAGLPACPEYHGFQQFGCTQTQHCGPCGS